MLTFIVRRIIYSIPVLIIASVLVFFFVHATTDPLARFRRDPNTRTEAGLRIGVLEKPCTKVGPDRNILKCREDRRGPSTDAGRRTSCRATWATASSPVGR